MESVKLNFYNINSCGYYNSGNFRFGKLGDILSDFHTWTKGGSYKNLAETCTFSINDARGECLPVYCFDIAMSADGDDILLITWNETETLEAGMASVKGNDPVGNPNVETTEIPEGHIPGFPTYFWFSVSNNSFATIRADKSRLNGHVGLKMLLEGFLSKFSRYVVMDEDNEEVLGYRENHNDPFLPTNAPRFWTSVKKIDGELDLIRGNVSKITKILRKDCLHGMEEEDHGLLLKLFQNLGMTSTSTSAPIETKIKYEISISNLQDNQLEDIISSWDEDSTEWANVGFKIDGIKEEKWLSHSLVKINIDIPVVKTEKGIFSAKSLLNQILANKSNLLPLMER